MPRLLALPLFLVTRLGMLALSLVTCVFLTRRFGPAGAMGVWAVVVGIACGLVALLMRRAPVGRVTLAGRLAGILLPVGYSIGRGKLLPIVVASWTLWMLVGLAACVQVATGYDPRPRSPDGHRHITLAFALLIVSWLVDGWAFVYLLNTVTTRLGFASRGGRSLLLMQAALVAMIVGSAVLWHQGQSARALLLAGGPVLFVGLPYGLFILIVLITRRKRN